MMNESSIVGVLTKIYGRTPMNHALAKDLLKHLPEWEAKVANGFDLEQAVTNLIWNWWPGGDTAALAAKRVLSETK